MWCPFPSFIDGRIAQGGGDVKRAQWRLQSLLAEQAGTFIGCGGVRRFSEAECEMKRLYVVPANRRGGVGRTIAEALIEQARQLGYQAMLLDTLPSMIRAQELYALLGFEPTAAYRYNPAPGARFLRLELR